MGGPRPSRAAGECPAEGGVGGAEKTLRFLRQKPQNGHGTVSPVLRFVARGVALKRLSAGPSVQPRAALFQMRSSVCLFCHPRRPCPSPGSVRGPCSLLLPGWSLFLPRHLRRDLPAFLLPRWATWALCTFPPPGEDAFPPSLPRPPAPSPSPPPCLPLPPLAPAWSSGLPWATSGDSSLLPSSCRSKSPNAPHVPGSPSGQLLPSSPGSLTRAAVMREDVHLGQVCHEGAVLGLGLTILLGEVCPAGQWRRAASQPTSRCLAVSLRRGRSPCSGGLQRPRGRQKEPRLLCHMESESGSRT